MQNLTFTLCKLLHTHLGGTKHVETMMADVGTNMKVCVPVSLSVILTVFITSYLFCVSLIQSILNTIIEYPIDYVSLVTCFL